MRIRSTQLMTPRVSQSCPSCALIARAIRCPTDMPAGMRNALHAISGVLCRPQSGFHVLDLNIPRGTQRAFTFSGPRGSGAVRRCESVYLIGVTPCLSSVHPRRRTLSFQPCTPPGVAPPPEESNPCCAHPAYRVALRRLVPQVRRVLPWIATIPRHVQTGGVTHCCMRQHALVGVPLGSPHRFPRRHLLCTADHLSRWRTSCTCRRLR